MLIYILTAEDGNPVIKKKTIAKMTEIKKQELSTAIFA